MEMKDLVEAVKKHARENYEKSFGWSEVIECWTDAEIEDWLRKSRGPMVLPGEAIARMSEIVDIRDERYREAVGPDVPCGICGTMFPENTVCPNEWRNNHKFPTPGA